MYKILLQTGDRTFKDLAEKFLPHFESQMKVMAVSSVEKVMEELMRCEIDVIVVDHDGSSVDYFKTMDEMGRINMNIPSILLYRDLDAGQVSHAVDYNVDGMMQRGKSQPHLFFKTLSDKIILSAEKNRTRVERIINEKRMEALIHMAKMSNKDLSVIVDYALEKSVELTRSSIGYVSLYDKGKKRIKMLSWSSTAMDRCHMTNIPIEFDLDSTGVWGEPIRQRNTVVMNDYSHSRMIHKKGTPQGHVPLTRVLMIPIFHNGEIVGTAGVGNKNEDYTWFDEVQLNLMMEELFAIYYNIQTVKSYSKQASIINDLISMGPVGLMFVSEKMDVILLNEMGAKILDCRSVTSNSIPLDNLIPQNVEIRDIINLVNIDGMPHGIRKSLTVDGELRTYEITASSMDHNNEVGFVVVFNDITEVQLKDNIIRRALEHIDTIEGPVFRTLSSCREELIKLPVENITMNQMDSISRLDEVVDFIDDYRDVGMEQPTWMNLQGAVQIGMSGIDFSKVCLNVKTDGIKILADSAFSTVFKNLFKNSLKHSRCVTEINISCRISEGWLYIIYSDNGDGVVNEVSAATNDQMKNGRFGLYLIDSIVSISGFEMKCVNDGVKTSFEIRVPASSYSLG